MLITLKNPRNKQLEVSRDSAANRRLLISRKRVLVDFADQAQLSQFTAGENVTALKPFALAENDIVTVGKVGLRAEATTPTRENKTVLHCNDTALPLEETLDFLQNSGVKIDFAENWVHLRKSNTEPIIRVYTEAKSAVEADVLAQKFIAEIKAICNL